MAGGGAVASTRNVPRSEDARRDADVEAHARLDRHGAQVQILFFNVSGSPALEAAIRSDAEKLLATEARSCRCRIWLSSNGNVAKTRDLAPEYRAEVQLYGFESGALEGWKVIVRSVHGDAHGAALAAIRSASQSLAASARLRLPGARAKSRSGATTVGVMAHK